jgi:hypothetical protein
MSDNKIPITLTNNSKLTTLYVSGSRGDFSENPDPNVGPNLGMAIGPGQSVEIGTWAPFATYNWAWIYLGRNQSTSHDYQVYFQWNTKGDPYRQEFGAYSSSSSYNTPNPNPLPSGVALAEHLGSEWGSEFRYVYDDTFKHKSRLSKQSTPPDAWEHWEEEKWNPVHMIAPDVASCVLSIDRVYANVKLEIQKNCDRNFKMSVYLSDHSPDPRFQPREISGEQPAVFEFHLPEGVSEWDYKTDGHYLKPDGSEDGPVPDPKFTIKRQG